MSEVLPQHVVAFLQELLPPRSELLQTIEKECQAEYIPLVDPEVGRFLQVLLQIKGARRVLELGTGIGYSTILLASLNDQKDRHITTIEIDEGRYRRACRNLEAAGVSQSVTALCGDAAEILPELSGMFDFIFLDAAKGQYPFLFEKAWRLLEPGGVIVCDNVFLNGWVIGRNWPERRKKTMVCRVRSFLENLRDDRRLDTTVLPLGDGLAVSVKGVGVDE